MISTACYPYPVNDKSIARRAALQPYIYSPSESHRSPRNAMYPHASGTPSPSYLYSGYEQYYSKDSWANAVPNFWPSLYPIPLRSLSLPETTIPQSVLASDTDTPSSTSSQPVLTPSSPFGRHDMDETGSMEFDEFDYDDDDDEDYIDSDFADEMEGIDDTDQEESFVYDASAPHAIKSTSALEGALGDTPSSLSSSYSTDSGLFTPADRRLTASVPGYPSASHQRLTSSPSSSHVLPDPDVSYPSQHTYTHRNYASTSLTSSDSSLVYNHLSSSSSLAGAFTSSAPSPHASRPTPSRPLPILQPQPIRPIPPIPLADLTSSANAESSSSPAPCSLRETPPHPSLVRAPSPLPLLCQPVSDAVRYQLKEQPSVGAPDDIRYDERSTSDSMVCEDSATASEGHRFTLRHRHHHGLMFCHEPPSCGGSRSAVGEKLYSYGCVDLPISWH